MAPGTFNCTSNGTATRCSVVYSSEINASYGEIVKREEIIRPRSQRRRESDPGLPFRFPRPHRILAAIDARLSAWLGRALQGGQK